MRCKMRRTSERNRVPFPDRNLATFLLAHPERLDFFLQKLFQSTKIHQLPTVIVRLSFRNASIRLCSGVGFGKAGKVGAQRGVGDRRNHSVHLICERS